MKKFFMTLCLILAFALGTLFPIANAFEIPSFVKDIEIYDVTENQVFLAEIERLYHKRFDSEQDKTNYTQAFTRFRAKVENIKSGNMH